MWQWLEVLSVAAAMVLGGCARYQSAPITQEAIERRLAGPTDDALKMDIAKLNHPILKPLPIDLNQGLTPQQAAIVAVVMNPSLRAIRDQRDAAEAQLLQAGILPNPQLSYDFDHPIGGGVTEGTSDGFGLGVNWDLQELISRNARVAAARADVKSVNLDIAWQEWQVAEATEQAAVDVLSLEAQTAISEDVDHRFADELTVTQKAVDQHEKTILELAAAEAASRDAHAALLQAQRDERHARLALNRSLGFPPETNVPVRSENSGASLPDFKPPSFAELVSGLEDRRLDLLALKRGYESEEETLRAAVLGQFPKINIGFTRATDTTNVHTIGFGVVVDIPIFDRNQGAIAAEHATRQRLYDEYMQRIFEARSDIAMSLDDIQAITGQIADAEAALPGLQRLVATYRDALDHGNADVLSYYTAQIDVVQKTIDILKLRQQLADNRIALQIAAGRFLPEQSTSATQPSEPSDNSTTRPATGGIP